MQEAWVWAIIGFMMGFASALFVVWIGVRHAEKIAAKKVTQITTPAFTDQSYTLTHTDRQIYVTFCAPQGYKYVDTKENALVVTLPGVALAEEAV